jgi:hypothetical protein
MKLVLVDAERLKAAWGCQVRYSGWRHRPGNYPVSDEGGGGVEAEPECEAG